MKQTEKFISHTCIYTVFISIAFYIFSSMVNQKGLSMTFGRFFTIFAFSMVMASMEYVFTIAKINKALQYAIHYLTLCAAFNVVFFTIRKANSDFVFGASTVFAAVVLFTFGYVLVVLTMCLLKKLLLKATPTDSKPTKATEQYQSRFK